MSLSGNDRKLIHFVTLGKHGKVRDLLRGGANVNAQTDDGGTALSIACECGHLELVSQLLENDAVDVNAILNGQTALTVAIRHFHQHIVKALITHDNVDVNHQCEDGATALYIASQLGLVGIVHELLTHSKIDLNVKHVDGSTAREVAFRNRHHGIVNIFDGHTEVLRAVENDRESLRHVMITDSAPPVELSYHYIERCVLKELGSGSYGEVFLATDRNLPKKFAVKKINSSLCNQEVLTNIRNSFKRERSVRSVLVSFGTMNPEQNPAPPSLEF
jgi:ankyrin repeat protein